MKVAVSLCLLPLLKRTARGNNKQNINSLCTRTMYCSRRHNKKHEAIPTGFTGSELNRPAGMKQVVYGAPWGWKMGFRFEPGRHHSTLDASTLRKGGGWKKAWGRSHSSNP